MVEEGEHDLAPCLYVINAVTELMVSAMAIVSTI
jgi:hypothetical protein